MSDRVEDRAAGAVLASACGDALGAGYEFGPPLPPHVAVVMKGGGAFNWAAGEWTDDTSMAIPILRIVARGEALQGVALDELVGAWAGWAQTASDVGAQTSAVIGAAHDRTGAAFLAASEAFAASHERSAGNGSLMRTTPVALAHLDDATELAATARRVSALTHADPLAGDACVLWSLAIRLAILTGDPHLRDGLDHLPAERRNVWAGLIDEAERLQPADFPQNGWAGGALQGAWSAFHHGRGLVDVLERAVRGGNDTDTVAAIAGGLAGAVYGANAIPAEWRRLVHGWPGLTADDLAELAVTATRARPMPPLRPERVLLDAVQVLHDRGYEGLRINPTFYATGHWRCSLRTIIGGDEIVHLQYSNGRWWDILADGQHGPIDAEALADLMIHRLPSLSVAKRAEAAYRFWYAALLEHCGDDRLPYLQNDYTSPLREGRMGVTGSRGSGLLEKSFPLPPG